MRELSMDEMDVVSGGKFYWEAAIAPPEITVTGHRFNWNDWAVWLESEAAMWDNIATDVGIIGGIFTIAAAAELGLNIPVDGIAIVLDATALAALAMSRANSLSAQALRHID